MRERLDMGSMAVIVIPFTLFNGQRAICMCHHADTNVKSTPLEGIVLKANTGSNKESSASGGGAWNYFIASNINAQNVLNVLFLNQQTLLAEAEPFLSSIEHVPKA